jgi:hypothetical protein
MDIVYAEHVAFLDCTLGLKHELAVNATANKVTRHFKIFSLKKSAKKMALLTRNKADFKKMIITLFF